MGRSFVPNLNTAKLPCMLCVLKEKGSTRLKVSVAKFSYIALTGETRNIIYINQKISGHLKDEDYT